MALSASVIAYHFAADFQTFVMKKLKSLMRKEVVTLQLLTLH